MILWSFDFVNAHAHAFFMDNVEWSHADSYFLSFVSDDVEKVDNIKQETDVAKPKKNSNQGVVGWVKDKGLWYYLNESGSMATGWVKDKGLWYYLNESGSMATGWVKDKGLWYYLNESGS
ncbi:TPA: hypothetical protein VWC69_001898, partial [Streptococcus pneumoniae]|nr:hypothetical protein [Streptococcus pneumoniae]